MEDKDLKNKSLAYWQQRLTPQQYKICRLKGTEAPFSGQYCHHFKRGSYCCACCDARHILFDSEAKYDSGTGWPSFFKPAQENAVTYSQDFSLNSVRTEVLCNSCNAHLGHVFDDGPFPTGKRYCINSTALAFMAPDDSNEGA